MTDSHRDMLDTTAKVLLRCWILGFVLLFFWFGAMQLMAKPIYELHGAMFGLSTHELDVVFYCGMGLLKLVVLTCFFLPWLAVKLVLRSRP